MFLIKESVKAASKDIKHMRFWWPGKVYSGRSKFRILGDQIWRVYCKWHRDKQLNRVQTEDGGHRGIPGKVITPFCGKHELS